MWTDAVLEREKKKSQYVTVNLILLSFSDLSTMFGQFPTGSLFTEGCASRRGVGTFGVQK